jgi:hypothetical protein
MADDEKKAKAAAPVQGPKKPFEEWAASKKTPKWALAGAKAGRQWPHGFEIAESEFDAVIDSVMNDRIG